LNYGIELKRGKQTINKETDKMDYKLYGLTEENVWIKGAVYIAHVKLSCQGFFCGNFFHLKNLFMNFVVNLKLYEMKLKRNFLLLMILVAMSVILKSQTIVSTEPENKNALIEEFTGIGCGFCPYGHKEAEEFITAHPGDGFSIAYHQGFYAIPGPGQPDFRTPYGDGLGDYFNVSGWPNALINRNDFGGGLLYTLDVWQQYGEQIISQPAYANIACEASVDVQSRELSVHVEIYYTGNSPAPTNRLNVAILQNDVKNIQFSSWFNPDAITPDGEYLHQHMFRDFITGQWGDEIGPATTGSFIDK
jgi:hypothetical protein